MKYMFPLLMILSGCSTLSQSVFKDQEGCFLLYNVRTGKYEKEIGKTCSDRIVACSTFKVPLALMAFDSGVLKDEKVTFKWDGTHHKKVAEWNKDHNAETWMANSVVWYSQKLTPKIGEKKIRKYLADFSYGNQDLSHGISDSWLVSPSSDESSLKISPYEQVEFLNRMYKGMLPVSSRAVELTKKLIYREISPSGFTFSGKTGSNSYDEDGKQQLGWFISHLKKGDEEYIAVLSFSDKKPRAEASFGGPRAREMLKELLIHEGLW